MQPKIHFPLVRKWTAISIYYFHYSFQLATSILHIFSFLFPIFSPREIIRVFVKIAKKVAKKKANQKLMQSS